MYHAIPGKEFVNNVSEIQLAGSDILRNITIPIWAV